MKSGHPAMALACWRHDYGEADASSPKANFPRSRRSTVLAGAMAEAAGTKFLSTGLVELSLFFLRKNHVPVIPISFRNGFLALTVNRRRTRTPPRLGSKRLHQRRNCRFSNDLIGFQSWPHLLSKNRLPLKGLRQYRRGLSWTPIHRHGREVRRRRAACGGDCLSARFRG